MNLTYKFKIIFMCMKFTHGGREQNYFKYSSCKKLFVFKLLLLTWASYFSYRITNFSVAKEYLMQANNTEHITVV